MVQFTRSPRLGLTICKTENLMLFGPFLQSLENFIVSKVQFVNTLRDWEEKTDR